MKKVAILQSNYIPWLGYFQIINQVDEFVVYDSVQYTKNDWRNRNQIKTPYGLKWLSIPVIKENLSQKSIDEVHVCPSEWRTEHLNKLKGNYSDSLYFHEVFEWFEGVLNKSKDLSKLSEINNLFIREICNILDIKTEIINSRDLFYSGDKNQRLIEICKSLDAAIYVSGPAAKNYIDEEMFNRENINLEWVEYDLNYKYLQLYGDFVYNVSVIDVLFNVGLINAKNILNRERF